MIEEGVKVTLACGHQEVWPRRQFHRELGEEAICRSCPSKIIYEDEEGPVEEPFHWEEVIGLEKVKIKTTTEVLPWD